MRTTLVVVAAFGLGLIAAPLIRDARADFTPPVMLSNGAVVDKLEFTFSGPVGNPVVLAMACGHAPLQGGGESDSNCREATLSAGTFRTNVISVRDGLALTFWKAKFPGL